MHYLIKSSTEHNNQYIIHDDSTPREKCFRKHEQSIYNMIVFMQKQKDGCHSAKAKIHDSWTEIEKHCLDHTKSNKTIIRARSKQKHII